MRETGLLDPSGVPVAPIVDTSINLVPLSAVSPRSVRSGTPSEGAGQSVTETRPSADESSREYGPNAWLIEEKYRQFQEFPDSVGERWRRFLSEHPPTETTASPGSGTGSDAAITWNIEEQNHEFRQNQLDD